MCVMAVLMGLSLDFPLILIHNREEVRDLIELISCEVSCLHCCKCMQTEAHSLMETLSTCASGLCPRHL